MNAILNKLAATCLLITSVAVFTGCEGEDKGPDQDYNGNWRGRTSHGGSVTFTVSGDMVTAFQINDSKAQIWLQQPQDIKGNSFSGEGGELFDKTSVSCTFDSATHCTGTYSIRKLMGSWEGTFEASRK